MLAEEYKKLKVDKRILLIDMELSIMSFYFMYFKSVIRICKKINK